MQLACLGSCVRAGSSYASSSVHRTSELPRSSGVRHVRDCDSFAEAADLAAQKLGRFVQARPLGTFGGLTCAKHRKAGK